MKNLIALALLLSFSTMSHAQVDGKDTHSSKSSKGALGTTGSQGASTESVGEAVKNNTCTKADGTILNKTDKGYKKCMKSKIEKKK
ncbi:MAG: hypothetical protein H7336_07810 [Bacteriovorax sp.]|nr:hypothetical protein [Bacteriovorax sp.]